MWQGIKTITGYKNNCTALSPTDNTLPDTLNHFFARFDRENKETNIQPALPERDQPIKLQHHKVRSVLRRVNIRKATGPDGVSGRIIKACADQLTGIYHHLQHLA